MQTQALAKIPLLIFNICIYSCSRLNSINVFSRSTCFGIFHPAWLIKMCWIASKTSTWNKLLQRQKRKDDQTNLNKQGIFQCMKFFLGLLQLTFKCNVLFGWFVQKIQGRDWRLPKKIEYKLACHSELFLFPLVAN